MFDSCSPDFHPVDANLRVAMRFFGEATGAGEVRDLDGLTAIYSGLDYGVFNIALLNRPLAARTGGLETRLADCARYFQNRSPRWSFWLCEDLLEPDERRRARQMFLECGMRGISRPPGMLAHSLAPPKRRLPELECCPVSDGRLRTAFADITAVSFDIPMTIARAVYQPAGAWNGGYQGFVGLVKGKPMCICATVATSDSLGIYSVGTLPEIRRRGYGEAMVRAAVAQTQARQPKPLSRLVLESTDAGHVLYQRMGFRDVARYSVYLTR
jgi:GNAT superfamily N-acetyltransferase